MNPSATRTGWGRPYGARRFHYFGLDRRSLCGRYGLMQTGLEEGRDTHSDNCAVCARQKAARPVAAAPPVTP